MIFFYDLHYNIIFMIIKLILTYILITKKIIII